MAGGYKTGQQCKTYYAIGGIGGTPTWVELTLTQEPTLDLSAEEGVVEDRASDYKRYVAGMFDAPLTLRMSRKVGNTAYMALRDAFFDRTIIGIGMYSGAMATAGEEGWEGDYIVTAFPIDEPINEVNSVEIQLRLAANSANAPSWNDVT